jgi:amino acid transporter
LVYVYGIGSGDPHRGAAQIARPFTAFFGAWILSVGAIVTLAAVAVAYQVVAPQISAAFEIIGTSGLPYLVKATLGGVIGNVFLIDSLIAITVCSLAVHAGGIRMIFTMSRDARLPFASACAASRPRCWPSTGPRCCWPGPACLWSAICPTAGWAP